MGNGYIKWYYTDIEKSREYVRKQYNKWISDEENKKKKKEYQKQWWLKVKKPREQEEARINKSIKKRRRFVKNGYVVKLKKDKGDNYFFYIEKDKKVVYISDKYNNIEMAKKEMLDAV